jgi:hypothetical protein
MDLERKSANLDSNSLSHFVKIILEISFSAPRELLGYPTNKY